LLDELHTDRYNNIDERSVFSDCVFLVLTLPCRFKKQLIEVKTNAMANSDLEIYFKVRLNCRAANEIEKCVFSINLRLIAGSGQGADEVPLDQDAGDQRGAARVLARHLLGQRHRRGWAVLLLRSLFVSLRCLLS
jgi:hypothetical protein